jgi:hypothetical protein
VTFNQIKNFAEDSLLQDAPLELKVWDYDLVSANDEIGRVQIDLNGFCSPTRRVKSSAGFRFSTRCAAFAARCTSPSKCSFSPIGISFATTLPVFIFFASTAALACYRVARIIGFVEDLVMGDDPEYHWTDSFRASRVSNEERQNLLYALSGRLRRQIGLKVIALGGNAVVAYRQEMTFEGVKGNIVVRGYGTACLLRRHATNVAALSLAPPSPALTPTGASPDGTPRDSPRQSF